MVWAKIYNYNFLKLLIDAVFQGYIPGYILVLVAEPGVGRFILSVGTSERCSQIFVDLAGTWYAFSTTIFPI